VVNLNGIEYVPNEAFQEDLNLKAIPMFNPPLINPGNWIRGIKVFDVPKGDYELHILRVDHRAGVGLEFGRSVQTTRDWLIWRLDPSEEALNLQENKIP
jgi:hypothetical protein